MSNPWLLVDDGSAVHAVDDDLTEETLADGPENLPPTQPGPNRVTAWVPTDETMVNLGAGFPGPTPPALDAGATVRTLWHAHIHTMGGANDATTQVATWVRLGLPSTKVAAALSIPNANPLEVRSIWEVPHNSWNGYSMLTMGGAIQEARQNFVILSDEADARVVAGRSVQIASPGDVFIAAEEAATAAHLVGNLHSQTSPSDGGISGTDEIQSANVGANWQTLRVALNYVSTAETFIDSAMAVLLGIQELMVGFKREPIHAAAGWQTSDASDWLVHFLADAAMLAQTALLVKGIAMPDSPGGRVMISSSSGCTMTGGITSKVYGGASASLTSPALASVYGGVSASLHSLVKASVSASVASLTGYKNASIEAQTGKLHLRARTDVDLSSQAGGVFITSFHDAQLNSLEGSLYLHGTNGFYLGTGGGAKVGGPFSAGTYTDGDGFGIKGTPSELKLGYISSDVNTFSSADPDYDCLIDMTQSELTLCVNTSTKIDITQGQIQINASDVTVNGQRIHLG